MRRLYVTPALCHGTRREQVVDLKLEFRAASEADLLAVVRLFADDELGAQREDASEPLNPAYQSAFDAIHADPNNELIVVEHDATLVGVLQLTFMPNLTHMGSWRCQIEGVRIHRQFRGRGLGAHLFAWAIKRAEQKGCKLVQLTSDKKRPEAHRFYEGLGFRASHEGFKLKLDPSDR